MTLTPNQWDETFFADYLDAARYVHDANANAERKQAEAAKPGDRITFQGGKEKA